jgi:hypothetical protein
MNIFCLLKEFQLPFKEHYYVPLHKFLDVPGGFLSWSKSWHTGAVFGKLLQWSMSTKVLISQVNI